MKKKTLSLILLLISCSLNAGAQTDGGTLKTVVVTGSTKKYDVDKDTYIITDSLRKDVVNTADMLGMLPGITYNWQDNSLSVYGQKNIRLVVNGVELSENYIKELNPKRVKSVEVVHNPNGRYASDNLAALINVVLYDDYVGWDATLGNTFRMKADKLDEWNWLVGEAPSLNYTYTRNNISVNASYDYGYTRMGIKYDESKKYADVLETGIGAVDGNDNMRRSGNSHRVSAGMDYQLAKNHILSFQTNYAFNDTRMKSSNSMWHRTPSEVKDGLVQNFNSDNSANDFVAALFYRGKLGENWSLYSDFNYNYYNAHNHSINNEEGWFSTEYRNYGRKNYLRFNADATYIFPSSATLKFGYATTWKGYYSHEELNNKWEESTDNYRHRLFAYYTYKINEKWSTSVGTSAEWLRFTNATTASNHFALLPDVRVMFKPSQKVNAQFLYISSADYPTLKQTSISYREDTLAVFQANPELHQAVTHQFSLCLRLWNCLTLTPSYRFSDNLITDYYQQTANNIVSESSINANFSSWAVNVNFEKPIWKTLIFSGNATFEHSSINHGSEKTSRNSLTGTATLMYMDRKSSMRYMLQYIQTTCTLPLIQGYARQGENFWMIGILKTCMKGKLSLMLAYLPPLQLGVYQDGKRCIDTNFYQNHSVTHMFDMMKNTLIFKANLRLSHGKRTKKQTNTVTTDKE